MSSKYLFCRDGHYYFRTKIPKDLASFFPRNELKKSLHSRELKNAKVAATSLHQRVEKTFMLLRSGIFDEEQAREVAAGLLGNRRNTHQKTMSELAQEFVKEHEKAWGPKSKLEYEGSYRLLVELAGDPKLHELNREKVREVRDDLMRLPANVYKIYPGKTVQQVLKMNPLNPMSLTSVNKHVSRLSSLLKFAIREGYITTNHCSRMKVSQARREDEERKTYGHDDLQRIVTGLVYDAKKPERFWIPLLGAFQGLRLDEICQLYVEDIRDVDGIACIDVNDEEDKKLKTLSSRRLIPIHPTLLDLQFLKYVDDVRISGQTRLWMNLQRRDADGYSNAFGKWYQRFNRKHVTDDPAKVFHSFRHTFTDNLKQAGVPEVVISELVGHAVDSITMSRYGKRYQPKVLLEGLRQLDYGIDLDWLKVRGG